MGAPTVTSPGTPSGVKLDDGFASCIVFDIAPNVPLWEIEVTPPELNGGEPINTTTHRNKKVHTKSPRKLYEVGETTHVCRYNAGTLAQIKSSLLNKPCSITIHMPDGTPTATESGLGLGSSVCFFGYLQKATPKPNKEGEPPELDVVIVATNEDPSDGSEAEPVITEV